MIDIKILDSPLDLADCINAVADDQCGAVVTFTGAVRNKTKNKTVLRLEFECYEAMALKEIGKIAQDIIRLYDIKSVSIHHRVGILQVGGIAVNIAVSAPHRQAAFDACSYAIDALKKTVPIWKKEIFEDGEQWVSAHA